MMNTTRFAGRVLRVLLLLAITLASLSMVDAFVAAVAPLSPATISVPHTTTTMHQYYQPLSLHVTTSMLDTVTPRRHRRHLITTTTTTLKVSTNNVDNDESVVTDDEYTQQTDNPIQHFVHRFLAAGGEYDEKEIGQRGEIYFFLQAVPIVGIALGGIPIVSDALRFAAGPGLLLVGIIVMTVTALDMGDALSPWPKPNGEGLVTTGLYGQVRHPMYAGVLSSLLGFSVWTQSVDRLLLVALLVVALEIKSDYEEGELTKAYPDYPQYQEKVTSKFVPQSLLELLRKNKEDNQS